MGHPDELFKLAQKIADGTPTFCKKKEPGEGNKATNDFMKELRSQAKQLFRDDFSEKAICGDNNSKVDFYFCEEETIVEVALSLWNSRSEVHLDILKAILALKNGHPVNKLLFISKPGAKKQLEAPLSRSIIEWVKEDYGIVVEVKELAESSLHTSSGVTQ